MRTTSIVSFAVLAICLAGCSLIKDLQATAAQAPEMVKQIADIVAQFQVFVAQVMEHFKSFTALLADLKAGFAAADTNSDGKTDSGEMMTWLATGGGTAAVGAIVAWVRTIKRNAASDARKDKLEAKVEGLEVAAAKA